MSDTDALPISPHQHEMSHDVHSPAKLVGVISKNTGSCHAVHAGDLLKQEWNILSRLIADATQCALNACPHSLYSHSYFSPPTLT